MSATIRDLNDQFRAEPFRRGRINLTCGIAAMAPDVQADALRKIAAFDAFSEDNDPWQEHDFGSFDLATGDRAFWKIDYYDRSMRYASENAADPRKTVRVMTIMLASEY